MNNKDTKDVRWKQRFDNYKKALITLEKVKQQTEDTSCNQDREETNQMALIQSFEFVFELGWKTMKDFLKEEGYKEVVSPRAVIKQFFANDYIKDGEMWLRALNDRNRTTHIYDEEEIKNVAELIKTEYYEIFNELKKFLIKQV